MIADVAQSSKIVVEKSTVPVRAAESIMKILSANHRPGTDNINIPGRTLDNKFFLIFF